MLLYSVPAAPDRKLGIPEEHEVCMQMMIPVAYMEIATNMASTGPRNAISGEDAAGLSDGVWPCGASR